MKSIVFSVLIIILSSALIVPIGYSHAENENQTDTNQTSTNQTNTNQTGKVNIGQEISDFVHNSNQLFKNQKAETLAAVKEYHEKLQNATSDTRDQIKQEFKSKMQSIREKYQDARKQFQEVFKQFREDVIVLRDEAQGKPISIDDENKAVKHMNEKGEKEGIRHLTDLQERSMKMNEHGINGTETALRHMNETENENMSSSGEQADRGHGQSDEKGSREKH